MSTLSPVQAANLITVNRATKAIFLVCGFSLASWAPMVPYAKDRLRLDDGEIGLLLLFLGAGAILTMPLTGWFIAKVGSRRVMLLASGVVALTLPTLLLMTTPAWMALMLFVFGSGVGSIDVAMNAHGVQVQNLAKRPIMSSLHGLFSVGGLLGSLGIGFLIKSGLQPLTAALCIAVLLLGIVLTYYRSLLDQPTEQAIMHQFAGPATDGGNRRSWLSPRVLLLGGMCFAVFLSEGAVLDWSALYLTEYKGLEEALSGLGYASFSVAMAFMRLIGDGIVARISSRLIVLGGCLVSMTGFMLLIATPWLLTALAGFVLIGLGAANIVPVFFSEGGRLRGISSAVAIPAITTMGYAGQLAGPAILGFIAQHSALPTAFIFTAGLLSLVGVGYWVKQLPEDI